MTDLIDEFQPKFPKGRNKALTLLVLTSVGSAGKLAFTGLIWSIVLLNDRMTYMSKDERFIFATVTIVCFCGLLNFFGSLLMFRQKRAGVWMYVLGQLLTALIVTWCTIVVNERLHEEEQFFLLGTYSVTITYIVLYLTNRKYWSKQKDSYERID